eukprot:TRINITY_DN1964_c0_g1_i10.p1 TRINITY_DN1964_c0_g1~~TRINITY_DN1964_c0_g1_i10.p1  ORF type:complete len:157 (+),score=39.65 TRINITY_DN1964_c0_g1_i10:92-562(+)
MIRRPPRSTLSSSSAASDVYKRQIMDTDRSMASSRSRVSDATTSRSDMTSGTNFEATIGELRGFNSSLKDELSELKGYVMQTQQRLGQLESMMDDPSSSRSRSRSGYSARSSARSSQKGYTNRSYRSRPVSSARSEASSVISAAREAIARSKSRQY